ncbi:hypothetical protein [Microcella sp.]|uniref:hypothetical protein n=1 Tax=Microcella sp. TaxID=1913979 RepID=UPI003F6FC8EF
MSEDLSAVDDAQLARWAYGRPGSAAEGERARLAAAELERRAAQRAGELATPPPSAGATVAPTPARAPADRGHPTAARAPEIDDVPPPDDEVPDPGARARARRRILVAAGVIAALVVAAGIAIPPLLDPAPPPRSSLDVFDREFSDEEREYLTLLQREGQRVNVGPRVIGTIEYGTVLAYRSIRNDPGQPERDQVCVAVAEYDRAAQSPQINDWQCVDRSDFETEGASVTLFGLGGQYDVDWGPRGRAQVEVIMTEAQRRVMDPGLESSFLDFPERELDRAYVDEQLLLEQTGLVVEQLRTVFPLGELLGDPTTEQPSTILPDAEWVAIYTGAPVDSDERVACLAVVAAGVQRESRCLSLVDNGGRGFLLEIEREGQTILVSWAATGEISAQGG